VDGRLVGALGAKGVRGTTVADIGEGFEGGEAPSAAFPIEVQPVTSKNVAAAKRRAIPTGMP
jgi:hypothetical protein